MLFLWKIVRKCSCSWYAWPKIIEQQGIKPCSLGSRIQDVEAFWYKTEIKIIYFVPLCLNVLIVSDCMIYPDPKFLIFKKISKIEYQKFRVRVNHTITHNQRNQTQLHKVNDFDFCFVSKCIHISNFRTKTTGLDIYFSYKTKTVTYYTIKVRMYHNVASSI